MKSFIQIILVLSAVSTLATTSYAGPSKEQPSPEAVQEYMVKVVAQIDAYLRALEPHRNAIVWIQGFIEIMKAYPWIDYIWIEGRLRAIDSDAYLIAAPISTGPAGHCARALFGIPEGQLPFYLWISVNGKAEATAQLEEFKIESSQQNLQNLAKTGLLMPLVTIN